MNVSSSVILWAVPFYIIMISFEVIVSLITHKDLYNKKETLSNIAVGVVQQVGDAAINLLLIPFYIYLNQNFKFLELENSFEIAIYFFIVKDFMYYWAHRVGHEVPFLWGIHLVHHQPKKYNYSVGLRMPLFHHLVDIFPLMIAALIGFPIEIFVTVSVVWASLQILTHTTFVKNEIPIFSLLFVTPSFHRVHHGKNDPYINKNYGGIFSLWDKIFGTYQPELEDNPVIFGVREKEYTLDPIGANLIYFKNLYKLIGGATYSSLNMLIIIICGTFFVLNAKQLNVVQAIIQSMMLIVVFQLMTKSKKI